MEAPEEKHTLKGGRRRVSPHWIHSVMPAQRQTFFHRGPAWNVPKTLITPTVKGLYCTVCVWVCAHESTCLINHWNPPHQSLTNRQHSKPGTRGQDRSQVVELTVQISCWTAKTKQNFYRGLCWKRQEGCKTLRYCRDANVTLGLWYS